MPNFKITVKDFYKTKAEFEPTPRVKILKKLSPKLKKNALRDLKMKNQFKFLKLSQNIYLERQRLKILNSKNSYQLKSTTATRSKKNIFIYP